MKKGYDYVQLMDVKYRHQQVFDVGRIVQDCPHSWFNQTLTKVNESVVRLGIIEGEYHWHEHEDDDEFFYVLSGRLLIDLEGHTLELDPNQGVTISRGIMHRTRAPQKTVLLLVETAEIDPIGDNAQ